MKIAILADTHANAIATESVFNDIRRHKPDVILFAGDAVGYYPDVNETCCLLRSANVIAVKGNHDAFSTGQITTLAEKRLHCSIDFTLQHLDDDNAEWLKSLPTHRLIEISGMQFMMCHGSPWNHLEEYIYPDYAFFDKFSNINADVIVLGHTHHPMIKKVGQRVIINPGSCGQPRDYDRRASYAMIDTETMEISIERVEYDVASVVQKTKAFGLADSAIRILLRDKFSKKG